MEEVVTGNVGLLGIITVDVLLILGVIIVEFFRKNTKNHLTRAILRARLYK